MYRIVSMHIIVNTLFKILKYEIFLSWTAWWFHVIIFISLIGQFCWHHLILKVSFLFNLSVFNLCLSFCISKGEEVHARMLYNGWYSFPMCVDKDKDGHCMLSICDFLIHKIGLYVDHFWQAFTIVRSNLCRRKRRAASFVVF